MMVESTANTQLSPTQEQQITDTLFENITSQLLPNAIKGLTEFCEVELLPKMKKDLMDAAIKILSEAKLEMQEDFHKSQFSKQDADHFMRSNGKTFNDFESKRDDAFKKATRYYEINKLYQEGLNMQPYYVP